MQQRDATLELQRVDLNRAKHGIEEALGFFNSKDIYAAAGVVLTLAGYKMERPATHYRTEELRSLLTHSVSSLADNDPDMLIVIQRYLDAIARARIIRQRRQLKRA
jgi:hypothetical protein